VMYYLHLVVVVFSCFIQETFSMSESFWADPNVEPKRNFRFLMYLNGIPQWVIKKTGKPTFKLGEAKHEYLNHTFYYPGRLEWDKITVELVDPVAPDASSRLMEILFDSGYNFPQNANQTTTVSKARAVNALGNVQIDQIGAEGQTVEAWVLKNAWITSAKFGDLDYKSDDLTGLSLEIRFDWAEQSTNGG